ncbi:hepatitis A virus cellular receptor 1 homolog [Hypomesus transpacificus]|uniref:hepatitis A virus cellular receptor 1 homolog n=1 Tax=Hypomesus transpacificus TaxID=137520 RepID=UPI001F081171|nr:hepatitis A virus cellular receptor 1 homolog [Hypomesus transpacificus]
MCCYLENMHFPLCLFISISLTAECMCGSLETVVGVWGRGVILPCRYDAGIQASLEVCWGRGAQAALFTCHHTLLSTNGRAVTHRSSHRYRFALGLRSGDVSMSMSGIRESDAGFYHCRVQLPGLFNDQTHVVHLIIRTDVSFIAPPLPAHPHRLSETPVTPSCRFTTTPGSTKTPGSTTTPDHVLMDHITGPVLGQVKRPRIQGTVFPLSGQLESYLGNTVRMAIIIFLSALVITVIYRIRISRKYKDIEEPASSSIV